MVIPRSLQTRVVYDALQWEADCVACVPKSEGRASLRRRASSAKALAAAGSGFGAQEAARPTFFPEGQS